MGIDYRKWCVAALAAGLFACVAEVEDGMDDADASAFEPESDGGEPGEQPEDVEQGGARQKAAFALTIIKQGSGAGLVTGTAGTTAAINCGVDCNEPILFPTAVSLTASASAGSSFAGWSGACSGSGLTCSLNVDAAGADVYARFEPLRTLTITKTGNCASSATIVTGTRVDTARTVINCGSDCSEKVVNGTRVVLRAPKVVIYANKRECRGAFVNNGACTPGSGTCEYSGLQDSTVTVKFDTWCYEPRKWNYWFACPRI